MNELKSDSRQIITKERAIVVAIIFLVLGILLVTLIVIGLGKSENKNNSDSDIDSTLEQQLIDNHHSKQDDNGQNIAGKETQKDDVERTKRLLMSFYNDYYGETPSKAFYFNIDEKDVFVVVSRDEEYYETVDILLTEDNIIRRVYTGSDGLYYAFYKDGEIHIMRKLYSNSENRYCSFSFYDEKLSICEIAEEDFVEGLRGAFLLNHNSKLKQEDLDSFERFDYSYDKVMSAIEYASDRDYLIYNSYFLKNNDQYSMFASCVHTTPEDKKYDYYYKMEIVHCSAEGVECVDNIVMAEKLGDYSEIYSMIGDFDKICWEQVEQEHYEVILWGMDEELSNVYALENGKPKKVLDKMILEKDENGIYALDWVTMGYRTTELGYVDGRYVQYESQIVDNEEMKRRFSNFESLNSENIAELKNRKEEYIEGWDYCDIAQVYDASLVDVRRGTNGKYYITYHYNFAVVEPNSSYDQQCDFDSYFYYTYYDDKGVLIKGQGIDSYDSKGKKEDRLWPEIPSI